MLKFVPVISIDRETVHCVAEGGNVVVHVRILTRVASNYYEASAINANVALY